MSTKSLLCFTLCSCRLVLSLGTTARNLTSIMYTTYADKIPLRLFFYRLNSASLFSLSSQEKYFSPFLTFVALH